MIAKGKNALLLDPNQDHIEIQDCHIESQIHTEIEVTADEQGL